MDLMDKLTTLLTAAVEPADKTQHDTEVARVREEIVQAKENLATEETRMAVVFRTLLSRRIGSESSWQRHNPGRTQ